MYMLFAGKSYPEGGANDFVGQYRSIPDAVRDFEPESYYSGWAHLFDTDRLEIVKVFVDGAWDDPI